MTEFRLKRFGGSIFITGFMASGKSTIGSLLAERLEWDFVDLDQLIEQKESRSINNIFSENSEEHFRKLEWKMMLELTREQTNRVVALGGGALHDQRVVDHLKIYGILVTLETPFEEIIERVYTNEDRPILYSGDGKKKSKESLISELKALYSKREIWYNQSQIKINTANYENNKALIEDLTKKIHLHV